MPPVLIQIACCEEQMTTELNTSCQLFKSIDRLVLVLLEFFNTSSVWCDLSKEATEIFFRTQCRLFSDLLCFCIRRVESLYKVSSCDCTDVLLLRLGAMYSSSKLLSNCDNTSKISSCQFVSQKRSISADENL